MGTVVVTVQSSPSLVQVTERETAIVEAPSPPEVIEVSRGSGVRWKVDEFAIAGAGPYVLSELPLDIYRTGTVETYADGVLQKQADWGVVANNSVTLPAGIATSYSFVQFKYAY